MASPNIDPTVRLFIGGLPFRFTEGELLSLFAPFGRIVSLKIMHTPWGKSRGMGFVEFDNLDCAIQAKRALHNHRVAEDRTIIVDYASPDPMSTDEGRSRHQEAFRRNPQKYTHPDESPTSSRPPRRPYQRSTYTSQTSENQQKPFGQRPRKFGQKPNFSGGHSRQSVFDSRSHHSRVGAKFAKRRSR
jgi:RNA recognition motif-containing protein